MTDDQELSFSQTLGRLDSILRDIESGTTDLDELAGQVQTAAELIRDCRARLLRTEERVREVIEELDETAPEKGES